MGITGYDLLRPPAKFRVSRFLSHFFSDPHVFPKNTAVITNPTRGAKPLKS